MTAPAPSAFDWAAGQVVRVRDDTPARIALLARTYRGPPRRIRRHLPFRRAALSFMRWQAGRGVLEPLTSSPPGSGWWRAVNERLLHDGCESLALSAGLAGDPSAPSVGLWREFVERPTADRWYRAHNATIVGAYIDNEGLAAAERPSERFVLNVVLLRVLYAHCLVANPALALGAFSRLGRLVGDPRLGFAGAFLSLRRVLPDVYPVDGDVQRLIADEHGVGRVLDRLLIGPRLQRLYEWSAHELRLPRLLDFVADGSPAYVWPAEGPRAWPRPLDSAPQRALAAITAPRWDATGDSGRRDAG